MRISAKADYAVRAMAELAASGEGPLKAEEIARAQQIPPKFLLNILTDLKNSGLVRSRRGMEGGFELARPASSITVADVMRAVDGPLANVHESRPEELEYTGPAERLRDVWIAVRGSLRSVLEGVTLADLAAGHLSSSVVAHAADSSGTAPGR